MRSILAFALVFASSTVALIPHAQSFGRKTCEVVRQGANVDAYYCAGNPNGVYRCQADVVYESGFSQTIKGSTCHRTPSDCVGNGAGAIHTCSASGY